ncbi:MAG: tetratricopeptide repeat protein [Fibrobacterota bacterium]
MNKVVFGVLFLCVSGYSYVISPREVTMASQINDLLVNCRFSRADHLSDSLLRSAPDNLLYYYMRVAVIGLESLDRNKTVHKDVFDSVYEAGMERIDTVSRTTSDVVMIEGFLQASYFSFLLLDGQYLRGIRLGRGALETIERSKSMNPRNYDADYFIGFYGFARGEIQNRLRLLLFWLPDATQEGITSLIECMDKSRFMSTAAAMVLADVYIRNGQLEKGKPLLDSLLNEYPDSRFLYWSRARYFDALKENYLAGDVYALLARRYMAASFHHNALNTATLALERYAAHNPRPREDMQDLIDSVKTEISPHELDSSDRGIYENIITYFK